MSANARGDDPNNANLAGDIRADLKSAGLVGETVAERNGSLVKILQQKWSIGDILQRVSQLCQFGMTARSE